MRMQFRTGFVAAGTVTLLALVGTPAGASQTKSPLADYEVLNQAVTSMSVQFTVPTYTCAASDDAVNAYADTFDQANGGEFAFTGAYAFLGCTTSKKPKIEATLEMDGTYSFPKIKIKEGDVLVVTVTCGATGSTATLADTTKSTSVEASSTAASECNGAFMGNIGTSNAAGTKNLPLPTFKKMSFTAATINGADLGTFSPTAVDYYEGKKNVITVGPLTDPESWTNTEGS